MHEASITQSILNTVLGILEKEHIEKLVTAVYVTVGVCQGLIQESMVMFFDMNKTGTLLEHAELVVTTQGMAAYCPQCKKEHKLSIPVMYCPFCGEVMNLTKGNEIIISSIEVQE